jgi:hypothetical protein
MEMLLKETPLFEACVQRKNNRLSSVLMFLNAYTIHQVINTFQDELFRLLGCEILLENNVMLKSRYEARKLVSSLGLNYTSMYTCEQGCILYCKENKDLLVCPICKVSRYVEGLETIPCKVSRYVEGLENPLQGSLTFHSYPLLEEDVLVQEHNLACAMA